jgi:arylsulfatase A-like enzyme
LRGPEIPRGARVGHLAGLVDLAPTLLALLGLPPIAGAQGVDLSPLLRGGASIHDAIFTDGVYEGEPGWGSSVVADVRGRRWSYVNRVRPNGLRGQRTFTAEAAGELYDLTSDPLQHSDVAADHPQVARQLRDQLLAWYRANELRARQLRAERTHTGISDEEAEHLRALGYGE